MRKLHLLTLLACVLVAGCGGVRARRDYLIHHAVGALLDPGEAITRVDGIHRCDRSGDDRDGELSESRLLPLNLAPGVALAEADRALARGCRAEGHNWTRAVIAYRDAATFAATALDDPATDPARAILVHNTALERLLRLTWSRGDGKDAQRVLAPLGIAVVGANGTLDPDRVERLDIAIDLRISGLSHRFVNSGLGVPVVASWKNPREARRTVEDHYLPEHVVAAGTAVLHPGGEGRRAALTLHDPFEEPQVASTGGRSLPLAGDRTAALASQAARDRSLRGAAFGGAVTSNLRRFEERLALLRPHRPGRIPVVFVHGLASSPLIWAETVNELGNDASLNERFEFWFFLYASGEPIPLSASKLREALAAARSDFDPVGIDPTLHRMVVVGHSQGGLLSKTLAQDSGLTLWNEVFHVPHPATRLAAETQARLDRALLYRRDAGVHRLVFVGTPHRGSPVADQPLIRGLSGVARPESNVARHAREVQAAYGRDSVEGGLRGSILGLGNLRTDSPILAGLNKIPYDPSVPRHTIALQLDRFNPRDGDGLVPYASAHMETAVSEVIVPGFHLDINQPGVTDELRRLLRLHWEEERLLGAEGAVHPPTAPADPQLD